jgi:glucose-1-phosphate thymidylyltransferase
MKGLIISGGKGSRLRPFTYTGAKQMVPIANKPILFYVIEHLVQAGVTDLHIVISPETGDQIRTETGDGQRFGASIEYIVQPQPGGIAQAIALGEQAMAGLPFVAFLGDNFLTHGIVPFVQRFSASPDDACIMLKQVPDARQFGVARFEGERLIQVVEKPAVPPSDLAVIGIYMFTPRVFGAIRSIKPSARGELEITDTIQWLLDHGAVVRAEVVDGEWIDTGRHDDLLSANRIVLQAGCSVVNSVISGPAIIGTRAVIENAYIGPFTSIDRDCHIAESEISGSVVLENTSIRRLSHRIEHSLIGRNVELMGDDRKPRGYQLILGDFSRVRVP